MEGRLLPHPLVVTRRGVEDTPLALGAHPGPRLGFGYVVTLPCHLAHHQHLTIIFVVVPVFIGLVPSLELLNPGHCRVLWVDHLCSESPSLVAGEPTTDQLVETRLVAKAPARAMYRNEASAAFDVSLQVLPLLWRNLSMVRIQQQSVELVKVSRVAECPLDGCDVIKVDGIPTESLGQHRVELVAVVMLAFVAEEQHADRARFRLGLGLYEG